ncbi:MAG: penicillin-binding protein 1C [Gammaproteobacteria bacterium]
MAEPGVRDRAGPVRFAPLAGLCLALAAVDAPAVPAFDTVRQGWQPSEAWLLDRDGRILQALRLDRSARRLAWTPIAQVSPALREAVIAGEDRRFLRHRGVDWLALAGALRDTLRGRTRGASTISMQVAAFVDPALSGPGRRDPLRKLAQLRAGRALDAAWSKDAILEAYLNMASYRGELQGVRSAAHGLFAKSPAGLTRAEAVLLAALLPAPGAAPEAVARRACAIALRTAAPPACADLTALARSTFGPRPAAAVQPPEDAGLTALAHRLLRRPGERLRTTIDARVQRETRAALAQRLAGLGPSNVRDGAAIVVDNASGEVLAYVASAGPASHAAQIDGVRARRQAGSTLKPFLYGLAIERRYLTAAAVLDDSRIGLQTGAGLYIPQNYDRDFKGPVSVRTALAGSLNVPAVRALMLAGVEPFRDALSEFGYAGIERPGEFYGFALALGAPEVSLLEQVAAYRALALGGQVSTLRFLADAPPSKPRRVLSAAAAFVIADILSDRAARAVTFGLDSALDTPYWSAVKTGTSKNMRDNWCLGFSTRYTVAVWVGNFEGDPMRDVSGVTGAAPAWQAIMAALHAGVPPPPPVAPPGVAAVEVVFSPAIEAPRREWFLWGTQSGRIALAGAGAAGRIRSPAEGEVVALDPDIPEPRQRMPFAADGAPRGARFVLNGTALGGAGRHLLWRPEPGEHRLALVAVDGAELDAVRFTVRGPR